MELYPIFGGMKTLCLSVTLVLQVALSTSGSMGVLQEYCEDESFEAQCADDEVIMMQMARYGRMRLGTCLNRNYGFVGCSNDVQYKFDTWCSGRTSCEVGVRDLLLDGPHPCPKDLRSYLDAKYTCVKVETFKPIQCRSESVKVALPSGYLASIQTEITGCGGFDSPWLIQAPPGQRINLTLYDFSSTVQNTPPGVQLCQVLAVIKEKGRNSETICRGDRRQQHVYLSLTNEVEIRAVLKKTTTEQTYFMFKYEAVGCRDLHIAPSAWFRRSPEGATVGCSSTGEEWKLTCHQGKWIGKMGNCTQVHLGEVSSLTVGSILSIPKGVAVVIVVIIAVAIGTLVLIFGLICIKRRRHRSLASSKLRQQDVTKEDGYMEQPHIDPVTHALNYPCDSVMYSPSIGENNYYRTWELQRHQNSTMSSTLPPYSSTTTGESYNGDYNEHIYESPKSARREKCSRGGGDSVQYYELDPNIVDPALNDNV